MKQMCKYALVQFMPFVETGEFANVGVLVCAPKSNYWEFKLAKNQFKRVTDFFKQMDRHVYKVAIDNFKREMKITKDLAYGRHARDLTQFFDEITRPRQALLRFSNVRTMMTDDPVQELERLYDRFIHRDFVNDQYKEQQMVTALKRQFTNQNVPVKYIERTLKVGFRTFTIPLAGETDKGLKLIKPLAFHQERPTQIFEHGEMWLNRLKALLTDTEQKVKAENILLPLDAADDLKTERKEAFEEVKKLFNTQDINIVGYQNKEKIVHFAKGEVY